MDASKQKPSLLQAPANGNWADQNKRILAALEHGGLPLPADRARRRHLDSLTVGLGVGLLLMSVMAWMVYDNAKSPALRLQDAAISVRTVAELAPPGAPAATVEANQAASIVTEPSALERTLTHLPAPPTATAAQNSGTLKTTPLRSTATSSTKLAPTATPQPATLSESPSPTLSATSAATLAATPTAPTTALPTHAPERAPAAAMSTPAPRHVALANPPANPNDTDVTLLTALVAHANSSTVVVPERTRDVVDRQDGASTESLLARCKLLGTIEGMLCRSRICAGRWDSDAACRAPSH